MAKRWNRRGKLSHCKPEFEGKRPSKPQRVARTPSETKKRKESKQ